MYKTEDQQKCLWNFESEDVINFRDVLLFFQKKCNEIQNLKGFMR